jgi:hypothetical protein
MQIIPMRFSENWPLISVFSGIALVPSGWHRYGCFRSRFVVPACMFVVLGSLMMVFSLHLVSFSFKQFILNWWPLLVVLAGLILVLIALGTKSGSGADPRSAKPASRESPAEFPGDTRQ